MTRLFAFPASDALRADFDAVLAAFSGPGLPAELAPVPVPVTADCARDAEAVLVLGGDGTRCAPRTSPGPPAYRCSG